MKYVMKYSFIASLILIALACRDEELVRFPDVSTGVNARLILYPERSYINFADLSKHPLHSMSIQ